MVIDLKVIPGELWGPADLSGAWALSVYETPKVIVIDENKNFVLTIS